jgi:hypothetical protein
MDPIHGKTAENPDIVNHLQQSWRLQNREPLKAVCLKYSLTTFRWSTFVKHGQLVQAFVFYLLLFDVFPDRFLVYANS